VFLKRNIAVLQQALDLCQVLQRRVAEHVEPGSRDGTTIVMLRTFSHCSRRSTSVMRDEERSQMTAAAPPSHRDKCS
jgi:hypothetical protein